MAKKKKGADPKKQIEKEIKEAGIVTTIGKGGKTTNKLKKRGSKGK
jgi:hypothetical protein